MKIEIAHKALTELPGATIVTRMRAATTWPSLGITALITTSQANQKQTPHISLPPFTTGLTGHPLLL